MGVSFMRIGELPISSSAPSIFQNFQMFTLKSNFGTINLTWEKPTKH